MFSGASSPSTKAQSEETPWDKQLQPDGVQIEISKHGKLVGSIRGQGRRTFDDRYCVRVMQDQFHTKEGDEEAQAVEKCPNRSCGRQAISRLKDEVVEAQNRASEVKW